MARNQELDSILWKIAAHFEKEADIDRDGGPNDAMEAQSMCMGYLEGYTSATYLRYQLADTIDRMESERATEMLAEIRNAHAIVSGMLNDKATADMVAWIGASESREKHARAIVTEVFAKWQRSNVPALSMDSHTLERAIAVLYAQAGLRIAEFVNIAAPFDTANVNWLAVASQIDNAAVQS